VCEEDLRSVPMSVLVPDDKPPPSPRSSIAEKLDNEKQVYAVPVAEFDDPNIDFDAVGLGEYLSYTFYTSLRSAGSDKLAAANVRGSSLYLVRARAFTADEGNGWTLRKKPGTHSTSLPIESYGFSVRSPASIIATLSWPSYLNTRGFGHASKVKRGRGGRLVGSRWGEASKKARLCHHVCKLAPLKEK